MCERKGVGRNFVDLRWGITSVMSETNQTVKICLDAIKKADLFVGFYGQMYGSLMVDGKDGQHWMVPALKLCYDDFPWLKGQPMVLSDEITTQKSVTHLEFECGYNDEHEQLMCDEKNSGGPVVRYACFRDKEYDEIQMKKSEKEA